jgi:hypothetical protein
MTVGILGTPADLAANTITNIYTVPAGLQASISINVLNRNSTSVTVRIAFSTTAGVQNPVDFYEFDAVIPPNTPLERTGIILQAARIVTVRSNTANVTAMVLGFEEVA